MAFYFLFRIDHPELCKQAKTNQPKKKHKKHTTTNKKFVKKGYVLKPNKAPDAILQIQQHKFWRRQTLSARDSIE